VWGGLANKSKERNLERPIQVITLISPLTNGGTARKKRAQPPIRVSGKRRGHGANTSGTGNSVERLSFFFGGNDPPSKREGSHNGSSLATLSKLDAKRRGKGGEILQLRDDTHKYWAFPKEKFENISG